MSDQTFECWREARHALQGARDLFAEGLADEKSRDAFASRIGRGARLVERVLLFWAAPESSGPASAPEAGAEFHRASQVLNALHYADAADPDRFDDEDAGRADAAAGVLLHAMERSVALLAYGGEPESAPDPKPEQSDSPDAGREWEPRS